ncbi:SDR family oxidoreductase [Parahaliea aestuarii]|uniref:SDR family oxidoreductase n=1 Tax=Parahaliea aestuarii TaxID=1852021 RepID=A0A5C9A589_9GAMM|nr:SDR family oxidoreductase [Parahaliea aestuarii]TXS94371.1 SDR family oxidoreductase [Parahaliea aestuarii]
MSQSGSPAVLVVGAGDFIGAEIGKRFAREGFVVCLGRRNGDKLAPLVQEIEAAGGRAHAYTLDARDESSVQAVFAEIEDNVGPLATVIFNVGANVRFPLQETTSRVFRKVWEMACFAGFLVGREAASYMAPRGTGSIFFTGATASMRGASGYAAFASAKFGLRALAQSMARELGPQNIHVAHLVIDSAVDTAWVRERIGAGGVDVAALPEDALMRPASVAEAYWQLHCQTRDAWTFELDIRPFAETW